jgi:hypothetical protein
MSNKIIQYTDFEIEKYLNDLQIVGSLSKLFSKNQAPFLHYRVAENIYCSSFSADNLSRSDVCADAKLHKTDTNFGVGIKTFLEEKRNTFQKIAEFNKQLNLYNNELNDIAKIKKIAQLRNKRLQATKDIYKIDKLIYHCVIRTDKLPNADNVNPAGFILFEEEICFIEIAKIKIKSSKHGNIAFTDGICRYQFNVAKNTLYKQFLTDDGFAKISVIILEDPLAELKKMELKNFGGKAQIKEVLALPLFTQRNSKRIVEQRSGLNQWNAKGRQRDPNEIYIPYPMAFRKDGFFPPRDKVFDVMLPNGETLSMKLCQDNCKALMSNPNKALGQWLLRDILKIEVGQIVTYDDLLSIGIDAIKFEKIDGKYKLNFLEIGEFEELDKNED